jgi:hypothetical protein
MNAQYESPKEPLPVHTQGKQIPGWDIPEDGTPKPSRLGLGASATGWAISDRFDRLLPSHKRYLGRSRRTFLICLAVISLLLVGLIIGLAVGLTKRSKYG